MRSLFLMLLFCSVLTAQVSLGGRTVPKESCVVFIFIGHSNMSGRCPDRDTVADAKLWNYSLDQLRPAGWRLAREAMYADRTINADIYGGPGMPFLKQIHERFPEHHFGLFLNAEGRGTAVAYLNNQDVNGHKLYEEIMTPLKDTSKIKGKVTFGGIVVMLGLVEAYLGSTAEIQNFAVNMKTLIQKMRYELGDMSLPLFMSQYEMCATGSFAPSLPNPQKIIQQIDSLATILPHAAVIPTDSVELNPYNNDDHHYSQKGFNTFTKRCVDTLIARGWNLPWAETAAENGLPAANAGRTLTIAPNPVNRGTGMAVRFTGDAAVSVRILDLQGRLIRALSPDAHSLIWDGLNSDGHHPAPGCYILSVRLNRERLHQKKFVILP